MAETLKKQIYERLQHSSALDTADHGPNHETQIHMATFDTAHPSKTAYSNAYAIDEHSHAKQNRRIPVSEGDVDLHYIARCCIYGDLLLLCCSETWVFPGKLVFFLLL